MLRKISSTYLLALILVLLPLSSEANTRLALVFGIDRYDHLPDLANAGNDARALSDKLSALGFDVMLREGATRREVYRAVSEFETRLTNDGGTGLVFFAGHGIQADGRNYLIPSDAQVEIEDDLEAEAIDAGRILESMARAGNPLNILVLDACRDNPLPRRTRSASRGLTVTSIPSGAKGTAIIYAAGEGQVAQDGPPGGNGIFTEALVNALDVPNLRLEDVIKQVTRGVLKKTNNRQRPWSLASIQGDFYFHPKEVVLSDTTQGSDSVTDNEAMARDVWEMIKGSDDPELLRSFTRRFPGTPYAASAESRLAMLSVNPPSAPATAPAASEAVTAAAQIQSYGPHEMVPVEGGCFMMGSQKHEPDRETDEIPHYVCIDSFLMDRYETTYEAYDQFAQETGRDLPDDEGMGRGRRPVISVEYEDALAYAEYACRSGGKEQRYCGGDDPQRFAVFDQDKTEPVGSKEPNGMGLYDMSGNAYEMTCSPYVDGGSFNPNQTYEGAELKCSQMWLHQLSHKEVSNAYRGGKWDSTANLLRSYSRGYTLYGRGSRNVNVREMGFRLVVETQ
jgi:formylglycine-generating enzyme required for sulfatase activity